MPFLVAVISSAWLILMTLLPGIITGDWSVPILIWGVIITAIVAIVAVLSIDKVIEEWNDG